MKALTPILDKSQSEYLSGYRGGGALPYTRYQVYVISGLRYDTAKKKSKDLDSRESYEVRWENECGVFSLLEHAAVVYSKKHVMTCTGGCGSNKNSQVRVYEGAWSNIRKVCVPVRSLAGII